MKKILELKNPNDYAIYVNSPVLHPHICIIRYEEIGLFRQSLNRYSCYGLFIQKSFPKNISYGMKTYETEGPSIIAVAPGQIGWIPVLLLLLQHRSGAEFKRMGTPVRTYRPDALWNGRKRRQSGSQGSATGISSCNFGILQPNLSQTNTFEFK